MIRQLSLASLTTLLLVLTASPLLATESSPSGKTEEIVQNTLDSAAQKAAEILQNKETLDAAQDQIAQTTSASRLKAFVGTIASISGKTITIDTTSGVKQAQIDDATTIVFTGKSKPQLSDLPVSHSIIAIGTTSDFQVLTSKRIIVYAPTPSTPRSVHFAQVDEINPNSRTIYLSSTKLDAQTKITISTRVQIFNTEMKKLTLKDIEADQQVTAVIHETEDGLVLTRLIIRQSPTSAARSCGDQVCQSEESPETCPADCQS